MVGLFVVGLLVVGLLVLSAVNHVIFWAFKLPKELHNLWDTFSSFQRSEIFILDGFPALMISVHPLPLDEMGGGQR